MGVSATLEASRETTTLQLLSTDTNSEKKTYAATSDGTYQKACPQEHETGEWSTLVAWMALEQPGEGHHLR